MELLDRMQNKIGPLPTWAWVAIPAGGFVALSWFRARTSSSDEVVPVAENISDSSAVDEYGLNTGSSYLPSYGAAPSGSSNLPGIELPKFDNLSWAKQATNFLITEGVTPTDATAAVAAYITGFPPTLNSTQYNALQKALQRFGAAPDGSTYNPTQATPTPAPTATVPEAPTTVTAILYGNTGFTVRWGVPQRTGNSAIIGYKVRWMYLDNATKTWKDAGTTLVLPTARSYTVARAIKQRQYRVHVSARNAKGYGKEAGASIYVP